MTTFRKLPMTSPKLTTGTSTSAISGGKEPGKWRGLRRMQLPQDRVVLPRFDAIALLQICVHEADPRLHREGVARGGTVEFAQRRIELTRTGQRGAEVRLRDDVRGIDDQRAAQIRNGLGELALAAQRDPEVVQDRGV